MKQRTPAGIEQRDRRRSLSWRAATGTTDPRSGSLRNSQCVASASLATAASICFVASLLALTGASYPGSSIPPPNSVGT
jgi:hypothetical protein